MSHLDVVHLVVVFLQIAIAVAGAAVTLILSAFSCRLDTDVLGWIRLLVEFVGEILCHDFAAVFILFLKRDLLKLLAHRVHDLSEAELHGFIGELTNGFIELFINFLSDTSGP